MSDTNLHPANRLLAWCFFILLPIDLSWPLLLGTTIFIVFLAFLLTPMALQSSLRRIRWLIIAMLVIFSWSTPGVYLMSGWYMPTIEGIYLGSEHVFRLIIVIASLQIALKGIDQTGLLSACYYLFYPLRWIGVDSTSFAVRLGLTLKYARSWLEDREKLSWQKLGTILDEIDEEYYPKAAEVEMITLSLLDKLVLAGLLGIFIFIIFDIKSVSS